MAKYLDWHTGAYYTLDKGAKIPQVEYSSNTANWGVQSHNEQNVVGVNWKPQPELPKVKAIYSGDLAEVGNAGGDSNSSTIAASAIASALKQIGGVVEGRAWFTAAFLHAAQGRDVSGFGEVKRIYNTIFDILVPMFYDACSTERQSLEAMGLGLEKYKMRVAARLYSHARYTW